jgi:hypothetical protein
MNLSRLLLPRLDVILLMALFWGVAASGPRILNFDGDLPRHLVVGQLIRERRSIPLTDEFSFRTEGFASIPHEWLSQVVFSTAYELLGLGGVVLLTALIVTAVWSIVFHEANRRAKSLFISLFLTALGFAASMIHVMPRPHIVTYLLTALWIVVLERILMGRPKHWIWLPILMLLWVNMHGMFVLGVIVWGIYVLGSFLDNPGTAWISKPATRSLLLGGLLSLFSTFLSPSGASIWKAITSLGSNSYITSRIPEYQSPNFHIPETWPFILLLGVVILAFARNNQKNSWTTILMTLAFTAIALYTSRMIPVCAIVLVPIAAKALGAWLRQEYPASRFSQMERNFSTINERSGGWVWMVVLLLVVGAVFRSGGSIDATGTGNHFDGRFFPVQAVDWLNQNPQYGHMFNEFDWGGYLLFKLSPPQQIFMDGHTHIYGEALTREYETVISMSEGWEDVIENYNIEWSIVRTNSPIAQALLHENWRTLYQDDTAIILRK